MPGPYGRERPLPWQYQAMALAHSKLTAQGQISVPAGVRRKLGIGPGSILEWDEDGEQSVVRRSARIRRRVRERHARR